MANFVLLYVCRWPACHKINHVILLFKFQLFYYTFSIQIKGKSYILTTTDKVSP